MDLKYFVFDFDDNILHMDTVLFMEKKVKNKWETVKITAEEFVHLKEHPNYRPLDNDWNKTFIEFSDEGKRGDDAFVKDVKKALSEKKYGPSYEDFIKCIVEARLFAIITARSHKTDTIRKGIEYIISSVLSDEQTVEMITNIKKFRKHFRENRTNNLIKSYLDNCEYIGVSSPKFEILLHQHNISIIDTPSAKILAFKMFVKKVRSFSKRNIQIGFSDDDPKNIKGMKKIIDALQVEYPNIDFSIFHTYEGSKNTIT